MKGEKGGRKGRIRDGISWDSAPGCRPGPQPVHPPVHDALQDGSKGGDANASPNEHGMLRGEDPTGGGSIRAVNVALCTGGIRGKREVGG